MSGVALYLHLRARGLELALVDRPERPDGCGTKIWGLSALEPGYRVHTRRWIRANKPALIALLKSGSPAAQAVRMGPQTTFTLAWLRRRCVEHNSRAAPQGSQPGG